MSNIIYYTIGFLLAGANFIGIFVFTFPFVLIYQIWQLVLFCFGKDKDDFIVIIYIKSLYKLCFKDLF